MPGHVNSYSSTTKDWSANQYLKFEAERSRPARDLLAQVPLTNPRHIVDLGCGPGNSTAIVRERYPSASLTGMDSSPDMLNKARATLPDVTFSQADLATYTPPPGTAVDLLFSNAVFQWLPHATRIPTMQRLLQSQPSGGVLALQVPDNFTEGSHAAMRAVADRSPFREVLAPLRPARERMPSPQELYDALKPLCATVDVWRTEYHHVLDDHQGVVEWVKGTGLRPFVDPLSEEMKTQFLEAYLSALKEVYPTSVDGKVILRYPRLFLVATRA